MQMNIQDPVDDEGHAIPNVSNEHLTDWFEP